MINIKILGKNKELFNCVCKSIERYGDMICKQRSISISTASEAFNELSGSSIAVFCSGFKGKIYGENFLAIFSSENRNAIDMLNGSSNIAISCGMSLKDTLSTASIADEMNMVSLQRAIRTIDGELIEPRDFYIKGNCELYSSLASSAILLLLGVTPENGFEF
ncbi:MAG: hypothetical protein SOT80_04785 [Candidatus Pseudoruminococcus sp.]|uniref:hypothetical protein n=1 Tax=Candidatus Pseudoruminococcus sp. TaxID=3101048 RepID=UPI002A7DDD5D|nr:hypothetical protein [Ruminococcus sp.]MDY2782704.1 hypothetical protein [Candidatus Pseudoruminococcus sp.]